VHLSRENAGRNNISELTDKQTCLLKKVQVRSASTPAVLRINLALKGGLLRRELPDFVIGLLHAALQALYFL
jgi:hypothetical protein